MKETILTILIGALCLNVYGQSNDGTERKHKNGKKISQGKCAPFYIAISSGLNNNTGIVGVTLDLPLSPNVSVEGGGGISSWGGKLYGGAKYFINPCHYGWAFGAGITYNTGLADFHDNLETVYGTTEPVELKLDPQVNLLLAMYRYWAVGRGSSRFYLELGYSARLSGDRFSQIWGDPISPNSANAINLITPGGAVVAVGFSFGVK